MSRNQIYVIKDIVDTLTSEDESVASTDNNI